MNWRPTADLDRIKLRASVNAEIRRFFAERHVLEVETPVLGRYTVSEPNIESFRLSGCAVDTFLQTSPEYCMKRLLAAGSGDVYSLGKAFRVDECGRYHNREFTLLEWYRLGFDDRSLAHELVELIETLAPGQVACFNTYAELFERATGLHPYQASVAELRAMASRELDIQWTDDDRSLWLDLLFTHLVEPSFAHGLQVVLDYPGCQSALARVVLDSNGYAVARRFELYWKGIELANGYWELTDAREQQHRFDLDNARREAMGLPVVAADENLLQALAHGLPDCAGVALGVDRLLMCLVDAKSIEEVLTFR